MGRTLRSADSRGKILASLIRVVDLSGKISAEDLEAALTEIVTSIEQNDAELALLEDMVSGDMAIACDPATLGSSAAAVAAAIGGDGFSRDVTITLKNTAGDELVHFNGSLPVAVTENTAGDGASALDGGITSVDFVDGVATVTINYTGTWAEGDTQTLTVGNTSSILGYSVADATSVDTLIA